MLDQFIEGFRGECPNLTHLEIYDDKSFIYVTAHRGKNRIHWRLNTPIQPDWYEWGHKHGGRADRILSKKG